MAIITVDKTMTVDSGTSCGAQVSLKKGTTLQAFTFKNTTFWLGDSSGPTSITIPVATSSGGVTSFTLGTGASAHNITVKGAMGATAPAAIDAAAWGIGIGTQSVPAGQAFWLSFILDGGSLDDAYGRDADAVVYMSVTVRVDVGSSFFEKTLWGKLTITTLGNMTFSWL